MSRKIKQILADIDDLIKEQDAFLANINDIPDEDLDEISKRLHEKSARLTAELDKAREAEYREG